MVDIGIFILKSACPVQNNELQWTIKCLQYLFETLIYRRFDFGHQSSAKEVLRIFGSTFYFCHTRVLTKDECAFRSFFLSCSMNVVNKSVWFWLVNRFKLQNPCTYKMIICHCCLCRRQGQKQPYVCAWLTVLKLLFFVSSWICRNKTN